MNDASSASGGEKSRTLTVSGYRKSDVVRELIESMEHENVESAQYWTAELVCSSLPDVLFGAFTAYYTDYVHTSNIKLMIVLDAFFNWSAELSSPHFRKKCAEMVILLCCAKKGRVYKSVKIAPADLNFATEGHRLKAPSTCFAEQVFLHTDPRELFIPVNEWMYQMEHGDDVNAMYWVDWLLSAILNYYKYIWNTRELCAPRQWVPGSDSVQQEPIWILWDVLLHHAPVSVTTLKQRVLQSAFHVFCEKYKWTVLKQRFKLIYFATSVCVDRTCNENVSILPPPHFMEHLDSQVADTYQRITQEDNVSCF